ncbi:hypothetical protein AMATHDRAFT_146939 [Amanita thiersii Skay4041]|uniref:HMG box domain-containing protein n=1 Tax=Amanita thiersii Skay4041 TaxID=703135 RepID=A0A2A9NFF5_9AGAR|nr:hypothetical protein AMATHDRAFT_146939 [Amanita thiersii Skay4041]
MTTHSPSPKSPQSVFPPRPPLSPAQAIAEAWKRESVKSQERWRKIDAEVKLRYLESRQQDSRSKL